MTLNDLVKRIDEILGHGEQLLTTRTQFDHNNPWYVSLAEMKGFRSEALSFIDRHFGSKHAYYVEFLQATSGHTENQALSGIAILKSIRGEVSGGWLISVKSLVSAEIFSDFLEMAEHLLASDYKDPAAVMIGSVLEEHLRQLCSKYCVDVSRPVNGKLAPKMGDMLNADLSKAGAYNMLDQKSVTAWLDLRNKAAHGKYSEYTKEQVEVMCQGVVNFMARNSV